MSNPLSARAAHYGQAVAWKERTGSFDRRDARTISWMKRVMLKKALQKFEEEQRILREEKKQFNAAIDWQRAEWKRRRLQHRPKILTQLSERKAA